MFNAKTLPVGDSRRLFLPLLKDFLYYGQSRERVRPARIERDMRHNFRNLCPCEAIVHRTVQVIRDLCDLARSNERAYPNAVV